MCSSDLGVMHHNVLPLKEVPSTADGFADVLGPGTSTMASFARALTVRGSESTLKLILGHGIKGDFEAAMSDFPRKPGGKPMSLTDQHLHSHYGASSGGGCYSRE